MDNQELENTLSDMASDIDGIKSDMANSSDIEAIKERLDELDKRFDWLKDEIIGYLHNNS